jgi:hypothetical protein
MSQPFFIRPIGEHRLLKLAGVESGREFSEIGGKGRDVVIVVLGIVAEVVRGQLARAPGLIKRVAQQIVGGDAGVELTKEGVWFQRERSFP